MVTTHEALPAAQWRDRESRHHARVDALVSAHRDRARAGVKHPVEDFLFTYYSLRPGQLRRWHPGVGVVLLGDDVELAERLAWRDHVRAGAPAPTGANPTGSIPTGTNPTGTNPTWTNPTGSIPTGAIPTGSNPTGAALVGVTLDPDAFLARRGDAVRHTLALLRATAGRPAQWGCFGLHEWAMVYRLREGEQRHEDWPLRLGRAGTDTVVEAHRIRCSHHDAFRFFTPEAVGRNALHPTRETRIALEQPGCLHATMDLYKWAYKLLPAVPSDLVLDCFSLARDVRELDMRASPYDLETLGYTPVRIETAEGKAAYVEAQRGFTERAAPLRAALIDVLTALTVPDRVGSGR